MNRENKKRRWSTALDVITVALVLVAIVLASMRIAAYVGTGSRSSLAVSDTMRVASYTKYAQGSRIGSSDTPVTIVEFGDYQCSFCKTAARYLWDVLQDHRSQVSLVYRHYPSPSRQESYSASLAASCAGFVGEFEDMHIVLFSQSESIGTKPWTHFAVDAGIQDTLAFSECLLSETSDQWVIRDTMAAFELGITGTPTFLINDLLVRGFHGDAVMDELIAKALGSTDK